jgi:hypothetical protein
MKEYTSKYQVHCPCDKTYLQMLSAGNWTVHIENIARSALKQVNVLRKLKFILSKQALSNSNLTYCCNMHLI